MRSAVVDLASQPVRNLCKNPDFTTTTIFWTPVSASLSLDNGRCLVTTSTASTTRSAAICSLSELQPPGFYSVSVDAQAINPKITSVRILFYNTTVPESSAATLTTSPPFAAPARLGVLRRSVSMSFDRVYFEFLSDVANPLLASEVAGWIDKVMITSADTLDFADGDFPGWRWTGTVDASESVGYPYTLESIAGSPVAQVVGIGTAPLTLEQMPALAGRTTYCVSDRFLLNKTGANIIHAHAVPSLPSQAAHIRTNGVTGAYSFRTQYVQGGEQYFEGYSTNVPGAGTRNIYVVAQFDGLTGYEHEVNGLTPRSVSNPAPVDGFLQAGLTTQNGVSGGSTYEAPVYTIQFLGFHNYETRKRITAWLARKYGTPIPAGY